MRKRHEKGKHSHYCILVNRSAAEYNKGCIAKLIGAIRRKGSYYTIFEPDSATHLYQMAQRACGLRRWHRGAPQQFSRRGKVTALIACGGDGTVNLVARVALKANLPLGIVPTGKLNNIALSLYGKADPERAISRAVGRNYRKIDTAIAAGQLFIGSAGLGLACTMTELLDNRRQPRFCLGWSGLASKAAAGVDLRKVVVKIDAFRFEVHPIIMNVNLLPYSFGLPLSPISVSDDRTAEVIFNFGVETEAFATFVRQVCRRKYIYGSSVKLFRGRDISLEPVKGMMLYYDGEMVSLNHDRLDIKIGTSQLKVYC